MNIDCSTTSKTEIKASIVLVLSCNLPQCLQNSPTCLFNFTSSIWKNIVLVALSQGDKIELLLSRVWLFNSVPDGFEPLNGLLWVYYLCCFLHIVGLFCCCILFFFWPSFPLFPLPGRIFPVCPVSVNIVCLCHSFFFFFSIFYNSIRFFHLP